MAAIRRVVRSDVDPETIITIEIDEDEKNISFVVSNGEEYGIAILDAGAAGAINAALSEVLGVYWANNAKR